MITIIGIVCIGYWQLALTYVLITFKPRWALIPLITLIFRSILDIRLIGTLIPSLILPFASVIGISILTKVPSRGETVWLVMLPILIVRAVLSIAIVAIPIG